MHVFSHVFGPQGILSKDGATTVLASHALHLLPFADHIVCIGANGEIIEQGNFGELCKADGYISRQNISASQPLPDITKPKDESALPLSSKTESTDKETALDHTKPTGVYRFYICSVGPVMCLIYLLLGIVYAFLYNFPRKSKYAEHLSDIS